MKRILVLLIAFLLIVNFADAQDFPSGMKYQAVARDLSGNVLADQAINLKITLYGAYDGKELVKPTEYVEYHETTTNRLGLFTLTIGAGKVESGVFELIPWSSNEIWMGVAIDATGGTDFASISESKLLAVPYAIHALTASELAGNQGGTKNGNNGTVWKLGGNNYHPQNPFILGTIPEEDLVFITGNEPALTIDGVTGKVTIVGDLDVGNDLDVANDVFLNTNLMGSTINNGDFTVANLSATDLTGTLNVDGATDLNSTLEVDGATDLNSTLEVDGATDLNSTLEVDGATDLNSTLNVDGATTLNGPTTVNNTLTVSKNAGTGGDHVATFENTASGNVMAIKVGAGTPTNANNFITFLNSGNGVVGRIEGESSAADLLANQEYQDDLHFNEVDVILASTAEGIAVAEELMAIGKVTASTTSSTFCAGVGACTTVPIPSWIISAAADLVLQTANLALQTADLILVIDARDQFISTHQSLLGITFASGSEDYAEYLPKLNPDERFQPGDVVGVKNGYVTKDTRDADFIMVISLKPVVLGGLPPDEDVSNLEIVAFMGQVSTKIMGKVNPGDYIIPSGYNNGFGIGKSPQLMTPEDYKNVLGVAWEGHDKIEIGFVNTAIGLNTNDLADVVQQQENKIKQLEDQMSILADLVPGFAAAANLKRTHDDDEHDHIIKEDLSPTTSLQDLFGQPSADQIVYFPVERAQLEEGFRLAEEISIKAYERTGKDINTHPFWNRIYTQPSYKDEVMDSMAEELKDAVHTHSKVNERIIEKN